MSAVKAQWDQTGYNAFIKSMSNKRYVEDQEALKRLFDKARSSPLAREALLWAENHGIKFHVDYRCGAHMIGGYYQNGAGVVGLSRSSVHGFGSWGVNVLVHEIRHAWQDYHGLMFANKKDAPLSTFYIRTALLEADAHAHGNVASLQMSKMFNQSKLNVTDEGLLRSYFKNWYEADTKCFRYARSTAKKQAINIGMMAKEKSNTRYELNETEYFIDGADPLLLSTAFSLGRGFNDGHKTYLNSRDKTLRDFFVKKALAPIWAMTCYRDPDKNKPDVFMQKVRKEEKRVARMSQNTP